MRTQGEMSQIIYHEKLKSLGLSEEYFYNLPLELQRAIMMAGSDDSKNNRDEFRKKVALKQYNLEEKVKEKVLTFIKKRG